ncbi:hyaluronate lyase [Pedobacter yulinensis]|uniref:Hyaluronate lyase n=1 Tax=Pedobacter yulinensis TaxID=2126353 RepID=A0A2T3HLB8_9SPHI|nr:Gfo/Idh/MocA family oxidoreductase [Pedobacter yulinensis]PST83216.1 hyaluronate lyase [Pedobacter yulinensis]
MERRKFIRNTGLLTAAALFEAPMNQLFAMAPAKVLNLGIIGTGDRGTGMMSIVRTMKDRFAIKAVCDIFDFRLAAARKISPAATSYNDYRKLLEDKTIDAVVIATPLNLHYNIAVDALEAGKHVYLEKTMTFDIPQALKLVKQAARYPRQIVQVGHQYRYSPLYFKVKEMIDKGYLGKVSQIDCHWDRNWDWRRAVPQGLNDRQINWRLYREFSGGLPAELLSHQIDFINWAFNTHPDQVLATGGVDVYKDGRETFDNVQALLRYKQTGMVGNFGATCGNARDGYIFKIKGTKGMISLLVNEGVFYPEPDTRKELQVVDGVSGATKIEWKKDGGIAVLPEKTKDGTYYAFEDFYRAVTEQKQPSSNVHTGATTAVCVHMINQAAFKGTVENWKPQYHV